MNKVTIRNKKMIDRLVSPCCKRKLVFSEKLIICGKCKARYEVKEGKPILMTSESENRLNNYLKKQKMTSFPFEKWPLVKLLFPPTETLRLVNKEEELISELGTEALVLDIGSENKRIDSRVVYLGLDSFMDLDVVADANCLPFEDNSFDLVICRFVLEHVDDPRRVIAEMYRVIKREGVVYVDVPFIQPYHDAPVDFWRFTLPALKAIMSDFSEIESGISVGPASALAWGLREFPGLFFTNKFLFRLSKFVFGWLFSPLKYLDIILVKKMRAHLFASAFYYIGKKET